MMRNIRRREQERARGLAEGASTLSSHAYVTGGHSERILTVLTGRALEKGSIMTESGLAIFVLLAFAVPIPILAWLDSRPRRNAK
jgi:hypothetical protein